ncbi:MAG: AAA family ATPase [Promethearchaeota archaeon]
MPAVDEIPWVEKYRPKSLQDIISQSTTVETLHKFVERRALPHIIFTGPAGTGKTSAAYAMINDLLGKDNVSQENILERNASDSVRMGTRDEIKNFVNHIGMRKSNSFKFVILDEADNISRDMQNALRRIIEMAPANVKFIFMCNYVEQIIDPVLSRCAIFRFYPLPKVAFEEQIRYIAKNEKVPSTQAILDSIFYISQGDMRHAINLFQMTVALLEDKEGNVQSKEINADSIYEISGFLTPDQLGDIFNNISKKKFLSTLNAIKKIKGLSSRGFFRQLMTSFIGNIDNQEKFPLLEKLLIKLAEYDYRLTQKADPTIQMNGLVAELISTLKE